MDEEDRFFLTLIGAGLMLAIIATAFNVVWYS